MSYNIVNPDGSITKIAGAGVKGKDGTNTQYAELPENPTDGMLIQYIGPTTDTYTYGYFYKYDQATSTWNQTDVQSRSGSIDFDELPTKGSTKAVTSNGIAVAIEQATGMAIDQIMLDYY